MEFVVDEGALGQIFLQVHCSISIILSVLSSGTGKIGLSEAVVARNSTCLCLIIITTTTTITMMGANFLRIDVEYRGGCN